ncbi:MAG: hypothetical protein KGJ05_02955, partial [Alphaproteobacteria bacterium]|nr:hypothetical protein [Alphaproteobacteria bacterium]
EFRLTSAPNQPITWQAGAFYFYSTNLNTTHYRDITTPQAPDIVQFPYYNMQRSVAGYGQADWHSGRNSFSAGIRYTADTIAQTDLASPGDGIYPARQSDSYSKWTWHVGDEFQFNTHSMAYIKADTGYRAGFFNLVVPVTGPSTIQPYAPEYVTSFEAGTKNRLMRGHLKLDADIFYMRYNGEQLLQSNQGGVITVNAAQTNIYGAEVSFAEQIEPLGEFDLNLNWLHARFGHQLFTNAVGQTYDIGGNRLTQAPDVSLTAAYEHVFKLKSGSVTARVQTKYQSGQYFDFYNVPDSYQKAYTRTDAHLTYQTQDGRWSIGAFVRNIENSLVIVDESESFAPPLSNPGTYNVGFQAPRTYGIQIGAKW